MRMTMLSIEYEILELENILWNTTEIKEKEKIQDCMNQLLKQKYEIEEKYQSELYNDYKYTRY